MNIINSIKKYGYCKSRYIYDEKFKKFTQDICDIRVNKAFREEEGYSNEINNNLSYDQWFYLENFTKDIFKQNYFWIKKYIFLPKVLKIQVLKTYYNKKSANYPTHAMLWHRDADDIFPHLKLIIPLQKIDKQNGYFSCASKEICDLNSRLVDQKLVDDLQKIPEKNHYRVSDKVRITEKKMREYFRKEIFDFEGNVGDILFCDTNYCYHRGGLVEKENLERNLITITIGGFTHSWNKYFLEKKNKTSIANLLPKIFKYLKKIYLQLKGGVREKKIILE